MRLGIPSDYSGSLTKNLYVFLIFSKCVEINSLTRNTLQMTLLLFRSYIHICAMLLGNQLLVICGRIYIKLNELCNIQWTLTRAEPLTVGSTIISLYIYGGNYIKSVVLYCLQWILFLALTNYVLSHICICKKSIKLRTENSAYNWKVTASRFFLKLLSRLSLYLRSSAVVCNVWATHPWRAV